MKKAMGALTVNVLATLFCMNLSPVWAAKSGLSVEPKINARELAILALRLPVDNRRAALLKQGDRVVTDLASLAFDESQTLSTRWRAITALGFFKTDSAKKAIERGLGSPKWYLRNSAILAAKSHPELALKWVKRLLADPALVVRTAAAQVAGQLKAPELEASLWKELGAKRNFAGTHSLFVRKYIVEALEGYARKGDEAKFVALLKDSDVRLYPHALAALEKITGDSLSTKNAPRKPYKPLEVRRLAWLDWAQKTYSGTSSPSSW